ncbi:hypothetical protein A3C67_00055 [Candidatus Nomurabacteria bacterium RIFCSPHIGHO2_02_FULL_42_19]|uniref:Uncharacterized protein n=1 Tax=Candidatus Nomurabacteria bacterium RIFCSPHIGHO2_02_FULL_42_19 TaxID=1801756 RepID=A0A1F6W469_9BACT|nr:MAG: hypothetical protein A3C67_00055 [Candidatus Nomurabacteria bacterium RIFCSPHIGHO2_02_FULL_42_19]
MSPIAQMIWACKKCWKKHNQGMYTALPTRPNSPFNPRIQWPICQTYKCGSIKFEARMEQVEVPAVTDAGG